MCFFTGSHWALVAPSLILLWAEVNCYWLKTKAGLMWVINSSTTYKIDYLWFATEPFSWSGVNASPGNASLSGRSRSIKDQTLPHSMERWLVCIVGIIQMYVSLHWAFTGLLLCLNTELLMVGNHLPKWALISKIRSHQTQIRPVTSADHWVMLVLPE